MEKQKPIQVFQPELREAEAAAVARVFASNWVGRGKLVQEFEAKWAEHIGVKPEHVVSINSATEGLFQIMDVLDIEAGDEVILPSISFVGAANAVAAKGAVPVFCDVNRETLNPTADHIREKMTNRTQAILLLHYGGVPAEEIEEIAKLGPSLIEDSACSPASTWNGKACGTFGEFGVWSFDAMKILVAGDGGMVYCEDLADAKWLRQQAYMGLGTESGASSKVDKRWWEFEVECAGRRSIMNDITAAIGLEQLKKLKDDFVGRRRMIHGEYNEGLYREKWLKLPPCMELAAESSHYFYWIQLPNESIRDRLAAHLRKKGIYTTFRYYPLHLVEFYGHEGGPLPGAEAAAKTTLCLPMHQGLSNSDVQRVIDEIQHFGKRL